MINVIEQTIRSHHPSVDVDKSITEDNVYHAICQVMRDNPDIFWFSHQWRYSQSEAIVRFRYTIDKERSAKIKKQIEDVVDNDFKLDYVRTLPVLEQVMYVYKWIALYCNYDIHSAHNQTIYSVFVHRHSVCTGIAKAAQYLLKRLGVESRLVFGKMNNSEEESRHCWLIVNIEGRFYHLDPTFALPETDRLLYQCNVEPLRGNDFLFYNYFCVKTDTIKQSRTIEEEELLPQCVENMDYNILQNINVIPSRNGDSAGLGSLLSDVGTTADIYLAHNEDKYNRHRFVAKVFRDDENHELLRKELIVMRECAGPHLLRARGSDFNKGILYMEQATPLSELLTSHYYKLTLKGFCNLLIDIASGLKELLERGIIYRDIHLNNIYLYEDPLFGKLTYKLGDFGSCTFVDKDGKFAGLTERGGVGSKWYMAPETWNEGVFDERSSVYGVGMIGYFLLNELCPPLFREVGPDCCAERRLEGQEFPAPDLKFANDKCLENAFSFIICKCVKYNPGYRYQTLTDFIDEIEELSKQLESRDYPLPICLENNIDDFSRTIIQYRWLDGNIKETSRPKYIEAKVTCSSCGNVFGINVLRSLIDNMLPSLPHDNAQGMLGLTIETETDIITCPYCSTITSIKESYAHNNLSLAPIGILRDKKAFVKEPHDTQNNNYANTRQRIDDFATTCAPCFPNSSAPYDENSQQDKPSESYFPCGSNGSSRTSSDRPVRCAPAPQSSPVPSSQSSKGLFGKIKDLIFGKSENPTSITPIEREPIAEKVNSSVFAPSETKRGDFMMVQVFLYKDDEERAVASKAAEVDPDARRKNYTPLSVKLKDGDKVKAKLTMSGKGIEVDEPIQEMIWQGHYTDCQFGVFVTEDYKPNSMMGTVMLTVNDVPCGRMMFKTKIVSQPQKLYAKIESKAFQKIFISYSHKDESTVKYFAKAFQAQGVDYFFDRHYLKAGDVYPLKIKEYINSADLFILCWSKNAAESDYVQLERQQALALAFPQKDMEQATLSIHPISIEPHADYPSDMKEVYNFEEI